MAQEKLHRFHIMLMVLNTQSGIALFTLPRITAHHFGTNGWLALVIVFLFATFNTMLISAVYRLGRGTSVFDILRASLPRVILYPLYLLIASNFAMFGCLVIKQYAMIYQLMIFPMTPDIVLKVFVDILVFLYITKGIYTMSKANIFFVVILVLQLPLTLFFIPDFALVRLTPFLFQGGKDMAEGFLFVYQTYLGYELTLFLFPYAEKTTKWLKYVHFANTLSMAIYLIITVMVFGFFNVHELNFSAFPILDMFGYLKFPFIERIHNFLLSMFLFSVVHTAAMYYWASKAVIKQVFPRIPPMLLVALTMAATIAVSLTPDSLMEVEWWLRNITLIQLVFSIGFPLLLILLLLIQRRRKKHA